MGFLSSEILNLVGISFATFAMFASDEYRAIKGQSPIPQMTFLPLAIAFMRHLLLEQLRLLLAPQAGLPGSVQLQKMRD